MSVSKLASFNDDKLLKAILSILMAQKLNNLSCNKNRISLKVKSFFASRIMSIVNVGIFDRCILFENLKDVHQIKKHFTDNRRKNIL